MKQRSLCCTDVRSETCDTIEPLFMYSSTGYTLFTRHTDYVSLCIVTLQLLSVVAVYFQLVIVSHLFLTYFILRVCPNLPRKSVWSTTEAVQYLSLGYTEVVK